MSTAPTSVLPTTPDEVTRLIDHAILTPVSTPAQITAELNQLRGIPLGSVCIKPFAVAQAVRELPGTAIGTVISFPHGACSPKVKAAETQQALADGAHDIDMVVNVGLVLGRQWPAVSDDIAAVLAPTRKGGGVLKVIFETALIPDDELKIRLCEICGQLGVDFVKTSTGFGFVKDPSGAMVARGATEHDVRLMRRHSPPQVQVKASGGIRSLDDLLAMVAAGATRIGAAATLAIRNEAIARFGGSAATHGSAAPAARDAGTY